MNNETKIGILVVIVLVILAFMTIRSGNFNLTRDGYAVKAHFSDIDGVNLNSPVMVNGYEVGIVKSIDIIDVGSETKMELTLWLKHKAVLREGTKAYVKNLGFMGEKYVGLITADISSPKLKPGATIIGSEPANMEALVAKGHSIADDVSGIASNLNERLDVNKDNIDNILLHLDDLTQSLSSLSVSLDERLTKNEGHIDTILENMNYTSVNIKEMSEDLRLHPWKLLHKSEK